MKSFWFASLGAFIGTLVGLILFAIIAIVGIGGALASLSPEPDLPEQIVLEIDLRQDLPDQAPTSGPAVLLGGGVGFVDVLLRLEAAKEDEAVVGLLIRASEMGVGSARAEELRAALIDFKSSGKFVIAHSQGAYGGGPSSYRAISAADEIWFQPGSELIASGVSFETLFLRGLFDSLSIAPQFEAFHEYKNAPNTYTETGYTEAHREALGDLAASLWEQALKDIAEDRGLNVEQVRTALEGSPLSSQRLIDLGLADKIDWPEDAQDYALEKAGSDAGFVSMAEYTPPSSSFGSPAIAIVGGNGAIITGGSGGSFFAEGSGFASDTIAASILEAAADASVEAIVFRVDSPGGSPTASDQIWRAIERVQDEHELPVVVSMASLAASGGYYVSAGADWIVANRSTITGSIGIFGGKFALAEGLSQIGVNAERVETGGTFTGAFTSTAALTEEQRALMRAWLARGYNRFIDLVAKGRGLSKAETDARARGRVWSGADALDQKLVDELGGLTTAIAKARELAEIDPEDELRIITYPQADEGFPFGGPMASTSAEDLAAIGELSEILSDPYVQSVLQEVEAARSGHLQARGPALNER